MTDMENGTCKSGKPVWFVTDCSTGFGRILAKSFLERGYRVAVTARNPDSIKDLAGLQAGRPEASGRFFKKKLRKKFSLPGTLKHPV